MELTTPDLECVERCATFTAPAAPESAALARRMTGAVLEVWKCPVDREATILLLDEVFTNAVVHGACDSFEGGSVTVVFVESPGGLLHVEVHDPRRGDGGMLTASHAGANSESGRGLDLVEALSADWGSKDTPDGKFVYFDMSPSGARSTSWERDNDATD